MHVLKNKLNLANMHNMKIADYEKCARAKPNEQTKPDKQNITKKIYQNQTKSNFQNILDGFFIAKVFQTICN